MSKFICTQCKKEYALSEKIWRCQCGSLLDIEFESRFPLDRIRKRKSTLWRYKEAIPVDDHSNAVTFGEGFTPLVELDIGGRAVFVKQDYLCPTGSFKDRGMSVLISKIKELHITTVVEDSSGNAGASIAAYCARAKIECEIFVPEQISPGKLAQIRLYGARLHRINGSRDQTARAAIEASRKNYYASHYWNPFFLQGTKTFSFEVCEQLDWQAPDTVILPVGNGSLLLGAYIGFAELMNSGIIDKMPRIIGVQVEDCAPIASAFRRNLDYIPDIIGQKTIAQGVAIAKPVRGMQVIEAVKMTGGDFITVHYQEILHALRELCENGFLVEPTAAVAIAACKRYVRDSRPNEVIVSVLTGSGLKTTEDLLSLLHIT
jgi:threonine synthase